MVVGPHPLDITKGYPLFFMCYLPEKFRAIFEGHLRDLFPYYEGGESLG